MIDMPQREVIEKIKEKTSLSQEEIEEKIKEKLRQLSGLISEDGAAHIIANELGVQLYKTEGIVKIKELSPNAKNVVVNAKVLQKYEVREFERNGNKGKVANILVGDETGKTRVVFWNEQVASYESLKEQDVIQIKNPYVKDNSGRTELHLNDRSTINTNPQGVTIDVPDKPAQEEREKKYLKDLQGTEQNVEVLATIVQVYEPRFFPVDPQTNKRVSDEDVANNKPHEWNYVTTCFLDDGTANVRTTFWKSQTQHLYGLSDEEILSWKDNPQKAQEAKHELLGEIIKVVGRAQKNEQFDRLELTANIVIKDVDPEQEIKRIQEAADEERTQEDNKEEQQEETTSQEEPAQEETPKQSDSTSKEEESTQVTPEEEKKNKPVVSIKEEVVSIDDLEDL